MHLVVSLHSLNRWHSAYHFVLPEGGWWCNQTSTRARITKDMKAEFDAFWYFVGDIFLVGIALQLVRRLETMFQ